MGATSGPRPEDCPQLGSPRPLHGFFFLALLACAAGAFASACMPTAESDGAWGSSDDDGDEGGGGGGGGPPPIPLVEGMGVGYFEVEVPNMDKFMLHGTLPVPPGVFPRADGKQPFGVVDVDGNTYGAQAEVTTWYPDAANDGADIVEIIARVSRGNLVPGTRAQYRIVLAEHAPPPNPGFPEIADLLNGPSNVPASVKSLLSNEFNLQIRSYDCFGNKYLALPFNGAGDKYLLRYGEHTAELRYFQRLMPSPLVTGPQGSLNHWLGAHIYLTTWNGEEMVGLDLRVSNADSGLDKTTEFDDPLDTVYFKYLELAVPNGWVVVQDYEDPFFGNGTSAGGLTTFPIVSANPGGKMHVIPWGGQFHRRLAICKIGGEERARAILRGAGLGFAIRAHDPVEGHEMWSWWNETTARFLPQRHLLPILDHVGFNEVRDYLINERNKLQGCLENGSSLGGYPVEAPVLGWAHPYGVDYGGMTGGAEINIFEGMETAWAYEVAGYQMYRMIHRMHTDRQPNALFDLLGEPACADDWVQTSGAGEYVPFSHFLVPMLGGDDAWGVSDAPQFQIDYVGSHSLHPDYEGELLSFFPHDYQHFARYTRAARVLSCLANDSLAQDDLLMQAENFKMSFHQYYNSSGGYVQGSGLKAKLLYVDEHFANGLGVGRGEGWGLDCTNAAYSAASLAWRAGRREWYDIVAQLLIDGQAACNGFLQAQVAEKFLDAKYRARQAIEHPILDNAIRGMLESVYRGVDPGFTAALEDLLEDSYYALISNMAWGPGESAPWQYTAVGPKDDTLPVWCSLSQMPADGYTDGAFDSWQNWSDFGYAHQLTGDSVFLTFAAKQLGGTPDLLTALEGGGLNNIANRAGLLAHMQHLNGDF